jgi:hypothetical protein
MKMEVLFVVLCDYIFGCTLCGGGTHSARLIESFCEERDLNFYDWKEMKMEVLFVVNKRSNKLTVLVEK